jgi:hypothetical protein
MLDCFTPLLDGSPKLYQKFQNQKKQKETYQSFKGTPACSRRPLPAIRRLMPATAG